MLYLSEERKKVIVNLKGVIISHAFHIKFWDLDKAKPKNSFKKIYETIVSSSYIYGILLLKV